MASLLFFKKQEAPEPIVIQAPAPLPANTAPEADSQQVKDAAAAETENMKKKKGMSSTIATSSEGLSSPAPTLKKKLGE